MKVKVKRPVEIDIRFVRIIAAVRYGDEDIPFDFPFRSVDVWDVTVDIDTGRIVGWPGIAASVEMKVCDEGTYHLLGDGGEVLAKIENDYVPNGVVPGEFGDYIAMEISEDGTVTNWPKHPKLDAFFRDED